MPIDASIYTNYLKAPKSIQEYDNEAAQAQANALALQQQRMQVNALQQQQSEDQALRSYLAGGAKLDTPEGQAGLYRVAPKSAGGILKNQAEIAKEKAQTGLYGAQTDEAKQKTDKGAFDLRLQKANEAIKDISSLSTPDEARASINRHFNLGDIDFQQANAMLKAVPDDPALFGKWRNDTVMRILDAKTRLELTAPKLEKIDNGGKITLRDLNGYSPTFNQDVGGAITKVATPGEVLQANTSRANNAATIAAENARSAQGVTYQTDGDGNFVALPTKAVPGAPIRGSVVLDANGKPVAGKDKTLTDSQGKATTFAARMQNAEKTIQELEQNGVSGSDVRTIAAGNGFTNFLASPEGQRYRQAQEDWVTANLRQESGAAIGKDEMQKDVRKFFPIPGDSEAVRAQKAKAREVATRGMMTQAGPGARQVPAISGGSATEPKSDAGVPSDIAAILQKHGGK